jgi:hypothetical protein
MTLAQIPVKEVHDDPATYRGVNVLRMHAGDPIPSPRAPQRYAVRVTPDLARDWLVRNHPNNRHLRPRLVKKYGGDMAVGLWAFTPESVVFSLSGVLQNGQNRLMAITEAGVPVWLMVDFGWPEDLIQQIDRGVARTNADGLHVEAVPNSAITAAAVSMVALYDLTVGTTLSWNAKTAPSSAMALNAYHADQDRWNDSVRHGRRVYDALQHGLGAGIWTAACYIIERSRDGDGLAFTEEIASGAGAPGSPTRRLADLYIRRSMTDTRSGDRREPMENILRAYKAWRSKGSLSFVGKQPGFTLSKVK